MTDTAEYWNDVRTHFSGYRPTYTCLVNLECKYEHKYETKRISSVTCRSCLEIISKTSELSKRLEESLRKRKESEENSRKKKKGFKLSSRISFGKYKYQNKTIQWIIDNDKRYFRWMLNQNVILTHPEVDEYFNKN
ncbi:hypothetical protein ACR786_06405 [Sphingobacterium multivorum]